MITHPGLKFVRILGVTAAVVAPVLFIAIGAPATALVGGAPPPPQSTPAVRIPEQAGPFVVVRHISRPFQDGVETLTQFRLDSCIQAREGTAYENRTPGVELGCEFHQLGVRVVIATDPGFTNVLQDFDATVDDHVLVRTGYDGLDDFDGPSGTRTLTSKGTFAQRVIEVDATASAFFCDPSGFDVWIKVVPRPGQIIGHGAYTAAIQDVAASVACVFHWNETL